MGSGVEAFATCKENFQMDCQQKEIARLQTGTNITVGITLEHVIFLES